MDSADLFSSLLQDPETMQKLAGIASELMGCGTAPPTAPPDAAASAPNEPPQPDNPPAFSMPDDRSADWMRRLAPVLSAMTQSGTNLANADRFQLLCALKPFLSSRTCEQIDRAAHLLRMARMAQTAAEQCMPQLYSGREG